jgi:hypothetical protein
MNTECIIDLAQEAAYWRGLDQVGVRVTPAGGNAEGKAEVTVELSVQVRSVCHGCGQPTPDVRSSGQHGCGAWIVPARAAGIIDPDSDDLDDMIGALADRLVESVTDQERTLREEAAELAGELHQEVIDALCRGDDSGIYDEVPQYGDYTVVHGDALVTCAEVRANTVDLWNTEEVATPLAELPEAAQETLRRRGE